MQNDILEEILEWSKERPGWQRDALRRLFTKGEITSADLDDLVDLCKAARGLNPPRAPETLTEEHLAIKGAGSNPVLLLSLTHHVGVNALAPEQTVTFGPNLTMVYGPNAAGKSGYTRILKRACRSRSTEDILGNVLSAEAPLKAQATIRYREGAKEKTLPWTPDIRSTGPLAAVSVFDSQSAPVYLRDKTDVAFRPFGLDIFDKLSGVCGEVRGRIENERAQLNAKVPTLPKLLEGTRAKSLVDSLTALTNIDEVRALASLSKDEQHRLKELQDQRRDLQTVDPRKRARELELKADRIDLVATHITDLVGAFGDAELARLRSAAEALKGARDALAILRKTTLTLDLLPGTGEQVWRKMWDATGEFSGIAYPGLPFPALSETARCPFCQQSIGQDAAVRLRHFQEYVSSNALAEVRKAERTYTSRLAATTQVTVARKDIDLAIDEVAADDSSLAERVRVFLQDATRVQEQVKLATAEEGKQLPTHGSSPAPVAEVLSAVKTLRDRATQLRTDTPAMELTVAAELNELEARASLGVYLQAVLDEIERKKRVAAYEQCLNETQTQPITRKSTELTKRLITDQLRETFRGELSKIDFNHLAVEIQAAGGSKGALFHRLVFTNAPGVIVTSVLSEGESRALSLAAFLTELSTAIGKSGIIFDDPVSSLDHIWRERIAHRLVDEAKNRQIIVFTHDLLFLRLLLDECGRLEVPCQHQYVRRDGQVGICSSDLPWIAMNVKDRIGKLRSRWQSADKLFRTSGSEAYETEAREIYGLLREAWEQAVSEVLLNNVVERYRHSIETQRVRFLYDITEEDCKAVDDAMTECSRWIRGHDHPPADATPFPKPAVWRQLLFPLNDN